jgi:hypothetical protein
MTNKTIEEIAESLPPLAEATTAGIAQHLYYYMKGNGMLKNLTPEERTSALEFVKTKVTESHSLGKSEGKKEALEELRGEVLNKGVEADRLSTIKEVEGDTEASFLFAMKAKSWFEALSLIDNQINNL